MKFHIVGINKSSLNTYKLLKKKNFKVTISDQKKYKDLAKKVKLSKKEKNFYYENHPNQILKSANKIIYSTGVIKKIEDYKDYNNSNKKISEIDLFNKLSKWPSKNILFVTGSKGKTSVCKKIYKTLRNKKLFKKIFYLDRNKYTFSNLPDYKDQFFLIAEVDYQSLLISKFIRAKYRIITNYLKSENKAFKSQNLYLKAKLKIFANLNQGDHILLNNQTFQKLKKNIESFKNKVILVKKSKSIRETNNNLTSMFVSIIEKNLNAKY